MFKKFLCFHGELRPEIVQFSSLLVLENFKNCIINLRCNILCCVCREDDEDDSNEQLKKASKGTKKLEKFFTCKESKQSSQPHRFFRERGLRPATKL